MSEVNNDIETFSLALSVVVPVFDEVENIESLIDEIQTVLGNAISHEVIFVDDCSQDGTLAKLMQLRHNRGSLRVLTHKRRSGQSAAIRSGINVAKSPLIVTLDGDGQNDPSDILKLLEAYENYGGAKKNILICGQRTERKDNFAKRLSSRVANFIRSRLLRDKIMDTGCGLKLFRRKDFIELPSFDHMHRFLAALMIRNGGKVIPILVSHRPRKCGKSKYGTFDRLWVGVFDLFGVIWLKCRPINPEVKEPE